MIAFDRTLDRDTRLDLAAVLQLCRGHVTPDLRARLGRRGATLHCAAVHAADMQEMNEASARRSRNPSRIETLKRFALHWRRIGEIVAATMEAPTMAKKPRGPMTANEYQAAIDKLELSQMAAARLLEIDPRTSRRYASGEIAIPQPTAKLLRLMVAGKITIADVAGA